MTKTICAVLLFFMFSVCSGAGAETENKKEAETPKVTQEERKIVEVIELLELMELLENMETVKDLDLLAGDE